MDISNNKITHDDDISVMFRDYIRTLPISKKARETLCKILYAGQMSAYYNGHNDGYCDALEGIPPVTKNG